MCELRVFQTGHRCLFLDTTRDPRPGEENGKGKLALLLSAPVQVCPPPHPATHTHTYTLVRVMHEASFSPSDGGPSGRVGGQA